ncbi:TPA: hypothetical protein VOP91_001401 [Streptococcus pyogenes]|nr:hypothetical protein [Streptococcus pyogenes]HES4619122.1 hypothetical protein [Streptococcus pyogenes]
MKPKKYPYSGKTKIVREEMPRFIMLSYTAFDSKLIGHIDIMKQTGVGETLIIFKIPKFFAYEEKQVRVNLPLHDVVRILNRY